MGSQATWEGHYRRPHEPPFTAVERDRTTVLLGGLSPWHDRLVSASLRSNGYRSRALPEVTRAAYQRATEYGNNGQCNPAYFTIGKLVKHLQDLEAAGASRDEIIDRHVFVTAGSCGTCRFGMYEAEYRYALANAGFEGFRVIVFGTDDGIDQSAGVEAGLDMNLDFFLGMVCAFNLGDVLRQMHWHTMGYAASDGAVEAASEDAIRTLERFVETREPFRLEHSRARLLVGTPLEDKATYLGKILHLVRDPAVLDAMREVRRHYDEVEVDPFRVKPIVKVIGEFWAQMTEGDGNFDMHRFLVDEGAEVYVDRSMFTRLMYLLHMHKESARDRRGIRNGEGRLEHHLAYYRKRGLLTLAERLLERENRRILDALDSGLPHMLDQYELARIARPYWNWRTSSGESHLEVAENIHAHTHHHCHMVLSVKPFSCMPSTQSDGVQIRVVEDHPGMIFLPVETAGDGEVIAHSRVQMALGSARSRARREMDQVLAGIRWSLEDLRSYARDHPGMLRATYPIPHTQGVVGRAANFALHVADRMDTRPALVALGGGGGR